MKLEITKASEVQVKSVEWLWYEKLYYLSVPKADLKPSNTTRF